jgi:hypothetical protein
MHGPPRSVDLVGVRFGGARDRAAREGRGRGQGHVESYFLKANDPHSPRAVWLKTTIYAARGECGSLAFWK